MNNTLKALASLLFFFIISFATQAQNCGSVVGFRATVADNGDGTHTYSFEVDVQSTSGGSKSVNISISCSSNTFVTNSCQESLATITTYPYGPFTVPTCTGDIVLDWTGYSNSACGGTSCGGSSLNPLPVELSMFKTNLHGNRIVLNWRSEQETNNKGYEVQKSKDGKSWEKLVWVDGAGTTIERQEYEVVDENPISGDNYYRLKQIDYDGGFEFSKVISAIYNSDETFIEVYPNPAKDRIELKGPDAEYANIKIINNVGRILMELEGPGTLIDISSLPKGLYYLSIQLDNKIFLERIIKE